MHRELPELGSWRSAGFVLVALTIATAVVIGAMLTVILRSQIHLVDHPLPGWPWG